MSFRICRLLAIAAFVTAAAASQSRAANLITLVAELHSPGGASGVVADASGNLFGTSTASVFEVVKTDTGYAGAPTDLADFDILHSGPYLSPLTIGANGDLFLEWPGIPPLGQPGALYEIVKTAEGYASTPTTVATFRYYRQPTSITLDRTGNIFGGATQSDVPPRKGTVYEILKLENGYPHKRTILTKFQGDFPDILIFDSHGNLFGTTDAGGTHGDGSVFEIAHTGIEYASTPTTLVSFDGANGSTPSGLTLDSKGNLLGTTFAGGTGGDGTVFEIVKKPRGYARIPTVLANFDGADGSEPNGLIADAAGDLFGVAEAGGAHGNGTVYELVKTDMGYASAPDILVNFCALTSCVDGATPAGALIADANGNLFGTTRYGGTPNLGEGTGTVFEITNSGFVVPAAFTGTPGKPGCTSANDATLIKDYHGLNNAAAALRYPGIPALEKAILNHCAGV